MGVMQRNKSGLKNEVSPLALSLATRNLTTRRASIAAAMSMAAMALCASQNAEADITYTYKGNPLTTSVNGGETNGNVKVVLTFDETTNARKSFTMSAYGTTISDKDTNVTGNYVFQFAPDPVTGIAAPGNPVRLWNLSLSTPSGYNIVTAHTGFSEVDSVYQTSISNPNVGSQTLNNPGTWTITTSTPPVTPTTPPPTVLQLAQLSKDVYATTAEGITGYALSPLTTSDSYGMKANAYISPDSSQVVIAFRGTYSGDGLALIKNFAADSSFLDGVPSQFITGSVPNAVSFLQQVKQSYPNANITLTGHSLGGATAQMIGAEANLSTSVFNAPGSLAIFSGITSLLSPAQGIGKGGTNTNYRIYGDQISLVGTQLSTTATLPLPSDISYLSTTSTTDVDQAMVFSLNLAGFEKAHSIDTIISDIQVNGTGSVSSDGQPNYIAPLKDALFPKITTIDSAKNVFKLEFGFELLGGGAQLSRLFDPGNGAKFTFTTDANSPDISCITPPTQDNVVSYNIRTQTGTTLSPFQTVQAGTQICFDSGVKSVEFDPIDQTGKSVTISDQFFFAAKFSAAGKVSATLIEEPVADFTNPPPVTPPANPPPSNPPSTPPATGSNGGNHHHGGGGATDPALILALSGAVLLQQLRRRKATLNNNGTFLDQPIVASSRPLSQNAQRKSILRADV